MESTEVKRRMKSNFLEQLEKIETKANSALMTKEKYFDIIKDVKRAKNSFKKKPRDYWLLKRYDVLVTKDGEKLTFPSKRLKSEIYFYITKDDLFDVIYETHLALRHAGRDKMVKELHKKYKNLTQLQVQTFLSVCEFCQQKKKSDKRCLSVNSMLYDQLNIRCQINFIDFQSNPDGKYNFVMIYEDCLTKFVILKPLENVSVEETANHILNIILLFGAPTIIQTDNGREFCEKLVRKVQEMWPEVKLVIGNQTQTDTQKEKQTIENMLNTWMQENCTNNWTKGLPFVQFKKNSCIHPEIKRSPYKAMFFTNSKMGLPSSSFPKEVLDLIQDEDDLNNIIHMMEKKNSEKKSEEIDSSAISDSEEVFTKIEYVQCVICVRDCVDKYSFCLHCMKPVHFTCAREVGDESEPTYSCVVCFIRNSIEKDPNFTF